MQFLARQADFDQLVTEFLKERGDSGGESFLTEAVSLDFHIDCIPLLT